VAGPSNDRDREAGSGRTVTGGASDGLLEAALEGHPRPRERLVHLLHELHDRDGEVSQHAVERLADRLGLSQVQVYGVASYHLGVAPAGGGSPDRSAGVVGTPAEPASPASAGGEGPSDGLRAVLARAPVEVLARICGSEAVIRAAMRPDRTDGGPTFDHWRRVAEAAGPTKLIVGVTAAGVAELGAVREEEVVEADPLVEGMMIAAHAVGASRGIVCLPRSDRGLASAVEEAAARLAAPGPGFEITVCRGFDGLVVAEPSALVAAIEGRRGTPSALAPEHWVEGVWGCPTLIGSLETFAAVARVDEWAGSVTTMLEGTVRHRGPVQVPQGTSLREIVMDIGGGTPEGRSVKAVLVGGATGFVVPESFLDHPLWTGAADGLASAAIPRRLTVLADGDCVVDLVRRCLAASEEESCGTCAPCRIGLAVLCEIVGRLGAGHASGADLAALERLGGFVAESSLCSLGRMAPVPLLSGLRHFRDEFVAHLGSEGCAGCRGAGEDLS